MKNETTLQLSAIYTDAKTGKDSIDSCITRAFTLGLGIAGEIVESVETIMNTNTISYPVISFAEYSDFMDVLKKEATCSGVLDFNNIRHVDIVISTVDDSFQTPENFVYERIGIQTRDHTPTIFIETLESLLLDKLFVKCRFMLSGGISDWSQLTLTSDNSAWVNA